MSSILILIVVLTAMLESKADEVSCDFIENLNWSIYPGGFETCSMMTNVKIHTPDTSIASNYDDEFEAIQFDENHEIKFLPVNVSEHFPNLIGISAWKCSIKTISKKNFEGLTQLIALGLGFNEIEVIDAHTFEDLTSLRKLYLRKRFLLFIQNEIFII